MGKWHYYNEFDPFAAEWLRNLIKKGLIPDGEVDTRSIVDVRPDDVREFVQCHWFGGIAGWPLALKFAGWPEDRPVWTGSCPCQPFSVAGKGKGTDDERHLWPAFFNLIRECRPAIVFGEQVASRAGREWLSGVFADLERVGYAGAGADLCAPGVGAPHIRQRLYWVATDVGDTNGSRRERYILHNPSQRGENSRNELGNGGGIRNMADATGQQKHEEQQRPSDDETGRRADGVGRCGLDNRQGDVVNSESVGRGEGRAEHELRSGRPTITGASSGDVADADSGQPRAGRGDDGEVRGISEAQRQSEYCASLSVRSGEANGSGNVANAEEPRLEGRRHGPAVEGSAPGNRDTRTMRGDTGNMADAENNGHKEWAHIKRPRSEDKQRRDDDLRSEHFGLSEFLHSNVANSDDERPQGFRANDYQAGRERPNIPEAGLCNGAGFWSDSEWRRGADGKERRTKRGVRLLAPGVSGGVALERTLPGGEKETHVYSRVGALRGFGNAIVPQLAAEFIKTFMSYGE